MDTRESTPSHPHWDELCLGVQGEKDKAYGCSGARWDIWYRLLREDSHGHVTQSTLKRINYPPPSKILKYVVIRTIKKYTTTEIHFLVLPSLSTVDYSSPRGARRILPRLRAP